MSTFEPVVRTFLQTLQHWRCTRQRPRL